MSDGQQDNQRRYPRNLQGLLQFALNATASEDAPHPSAFHELEPERREFLEKALKEMTVDVVEILVKAIRQLVSEKSTKDDQLQAIESILDQVDSIDTSNDFCKIGGIQAIQPCLSSPYPEVRSSTARLIGELAQQNPFSQKHLLDANVLPKLIELLDDLQTASSAIHAMSCMVRNFEPGLTAFIDMGGLECMLGCLQQHTDEKSVFVRALFLLTSISAEFPPVRDELIKLKAVEQIVSTIRPSDEYDVALETTLSILCLFTENEQAIIKCKEANLNLSQTLDDVIRLGQGNEGCLEALEYAKTLKERIYGTSRDSTDR